MDHQSNRSLQIGNICIQWSNLEYHLAVAIWTMIHVDVEVGKILTASLDIKQRASMAFAIAPKINAPITFKRAIKSVVEDLRKDLVDRRNQAVHGIHFTIDQLGATGIEMHRGKGGRDQRIQLDADLNDLGKSIHQTASAFDKAFAEYAGTLLGDYANSSKGLQAMEAILKDASQTIGEGATSGPS